MDSVVNRTIILIQKVSELRLKQSINTDQRDGKFNPN